MSTIVSRKLPRKRTRSISLRYRAYLREGAILPSESQRVTDRYDDEPNNFTFGIYFRRRTLQLDPHQCSDVRMARFPVSEMFADILHPELDRGEPIIDPTRFVADPDKAKRFPGTALCDGAARLCRLRTFQCRYWACQCSSRAPGILSQGVSAGDHGRAEIVPGPDQAGRTDGRQLSRRSATGVPALPVHAFERVRAADVVRAPGERQFAAECRGPRSSALRSFRIPEAAGLPRPIGPVPALLPGCASLPPPVQIGLPNG